MSTATETDLEERLRHDAEKAVEIAEHKARITQDEEGDETLTGSSAWRSYEFSAQEIADGWDSDLDTGVARIVELNPEESISSVMFWRHGFDVANMIGKIYITDSTPSVAEIQAMESLNTFDPTEDDAPRITRFDNDVVLGDENSWVSVSFNNDDNVAPETGVFYVSLEVIPAAG